MADIQSDIIDKNGYNLNIPRYIDTSEEEVEIDIAKVKSELEEIQARKKETLERVNALMKELGI